MENIQNKKFGETLSQYIFSIPAYIVFTLLTCGLFNLYWNYKQMEVCNKMLDREEFKFWNWLIFSILTCGLYHIYYQYQMGSAIMEIQRKVKTPVFDNLSMISLFVTLFGGSIIVDGIHQHEINKLII